MGIVGRCVRWLVLGAALAFGAAPAGALDPKRTLDQFHHTVWRVEEGAPPDIWALAQTPDGYLWIGTGGGLYRFDGVRFETVSPTRADDPPPSDINALLATATGDLWIGAFDGSVTLLRAGRLRRLDPCLRHGAAVNFSAGPDGAVWVAFDSMDGAGGLARVDHERCTPVGTAWGLPTATDARVVTAPNGAIWAVLDTAIYFLRPGEARFTKVNAPGAANRKIRFVGADGLLLIDAAGVALLSAAETMAHPQRRLAQGAERLPAPRLGGSALVDRDGMLWGSILTGGLFRASFDRRRPATAPQIFRSNQGLSSDLVRPIIEDREGNIWVGTNLGLDRFRAADVVSLPAVPLTSPWGYAGGADGHGGVIIHDSRSLYRVGPDLRTEILARDGAPPYGVCAAAGDVGGDPGIVWAATAAGFLRIAGGGVTHVAGPPGWALDKAGGCTIQRDKTLVAFLADGRLFRWAGGWRPLLVPDAPIGERLSWAKGDAAGGLWLCYGAGRLYHYTGGRLERLDGVNTARMGQITVLVEDGDDALIGGERGLGRLRGRAFRMLRPDQAPDLQRVSGLVLTPDGALWASGINGIWRFAASELTHALDDPSYHPRFLRFDSRDGVPGPAQQYWSWNTAFAAADRVWFITSHGMAWVESKRLRRNPLPPPVIIRALAAGGRLLPFPQAPTLPKGVRNIEIDYTATSLMTPERVRFRYRLDGVDSDWVDAGTRRQAFYTRLPPGDYAFRVIAANDSGVWNRIGATVRFRVPPLWFETPLFYALLVLLAVGAVWLLHLARVRRIAARMRGLLEERLAERERIARELHDTLLQGFQGLMLRFRAVATAVPLGGRAEALLDEALARAEQVLTEGRDSVRDLRLAGEGAELEAALAEAAHAAAGDSDAMFSLAVEGTHRALHPLICAECRRIGEEALANAFRHAKASTIEAIVTYGSRSLRLRVRDDGIGLSPEQLAGGADRHFGLVGMRERAGRIHGDLLITSGAGTGVSVELIVPARVAYDARRDLNKTVSGRFHEAITG